MFQSEELKNHLQQSSSISVNSLVVAEWNMNIATNIEKVGNYRYRPLESGTKYATVPYNYDPLDSGNFYTNATFSDVTIDGGFDKDDTPLAFTSQKQKEKFLFSLEDCLYRFRPRSGINKLRFLDNRYLHHSNPDLARRPRYYMGDKGDSFRYWTSYRTETRDPQPGQITTPAFREIGVANTTVSGRHYIEDAAPFVVYKNPVPANRLVVKMQTHVGDVNLGPFRDASGTFSDPFFGFENQQTPRSWKIEYLVDDSWITAQSFNETSLRPDGSQIIGPDGYVELVYGLILPDFYARRFKYFGELNSVAALPETNIDGAGYLIKDGTTDAGYYKIYVESSSSYSDPITPVYGWRLFDESLDSATPFVKDLTSPASYYDTTTQRLKYREFEYIRGIRVVVQTMNKFDSTFDLIEMSSRLAVDLSDKVTQFSITKSASDIAETGIPVGQLLASTGSISLFDYDSSFSSINENSIIKDYTANHIQFKFYEIVMDVDGFDYYVPIKTMYSEGFPETDLATRDTTIATRDLYFYFEALAAPQIFVSNVSLSYAISLLLDSIGFSNYAFFRVPGENDPIIPNFFIPPDTTVASVLSDLAISTQSAMFFDEYNNFVVMSKRYMLAGPEDREASLELIATKDFEKDGVVLNSSTGTTLSNIISVASAETPVFNDGGIAYTSRYIQRSYADVNQSLVADRDKTWVYKPVLLWQVSGTEVTKTINNEGSNMSTYSLSAIPLATDLSDIVPYVENGVVVNNILDLGEGVYFISRYNGYFFANGEVLKYDAVEFSVSGPGALDENGNIVSTVWIQSQREYENLFSKLAFNGKIFPTGRVRIYSEPNYETVDGITVLSNGPVVKHGRGQFGTPVVYHSAGLNPYWSERSNIYYLSSRFDRLISAYVESLTPEAQTSRASSRRSTTGGTRGFRQSKALVGGIIKNFMSQSTTTEIDAIKSYTPEVGTMQSSALVMQGVANSTVRFDDRSKLVDEINVVVKDLNDKYTHFGTRMRIVGKIENSSSRGQTPSGSSPYYTVANPSDPSKGVSIGGGGGGIAVMLNPSRREGYFFEIVALTEYSLPSAATGTQVYNVLFWKVQSGSDTLLHAGLAKILVDNGLFTGQQRFAGEETPTVYDLAVEYKDIGGTRRFYLYLNGQNVAIVDDESPTRPYNNVGLFVRGEARIMFENIYALNNNYSEDTSFELDTPVNTVFGDNIINVNDAFRRYAMSGIIQSTYLSGISSKAAPKYKIYFDEFGTIMREASYFNVKYDKAYPALYAKITPTFNRLKGYTVSGFRAGAYGAEFLVFNNTDTILNLDNKTGNSLTIQGVTFTSASENTLTVDEYFDKLSDFSDPEFYEDNTVRSPLIAKQIYDDIRNSRLVHGRNEFSIAGSYIQDYDTALDIMEWTISKTTRPRTSLGIEVFGLPIIQLGDIVTINFEDNSGVPQVKGAGTRFVVYHIEYSYEYGGPVSTIYVSEV